MQPNWKPGVDAKRHSNAGRKLPSSASRSPSRSIRARRSRNPAAPAAASAMTKNPCPAHGRRHNRSSLNGPGSEATPKWSRRAGRFPRRWRRRQFRRCLGRRWDRHHLLRQQQDGGGCKQRQNYRRRRQRTGQRKRLRKRRRQLQRHHRQERRPALRSRRLRNVPAIRRMRRALDRVETVAPTFVFRVDAALADAKASPN